MARPRKNRVDESLLDAMRSIAESNVAQNEAVEETAPVQSAPAQPVQEAVKEIAPEQKTFTAEEVAEMVKKAAADAAAEALKNAPQQQQPYIVQMPPDVERVTLRWFAPVADDNLAVFGAFGKTYGTATGKYGIVEVPKSDWSLFYDESNRRMIDKRWLIVLSGMTDGERRMYNCEYKPGEILSEDLFRGIVSMGEKLVPIFGGLCREHQEMVAREFMKAVEAGEIGDSARAYLKELNTISKKTYENEPEGDPRKKGLFAPVIAALNAADEE